MKLKTISLLAMLLTPLAAQSFDFDDGGPITVNADNARLDDIAGTAVYTGQVEIRQNQTVMTADRVVLYRNDSGLDRIEAEGSPARYQQPADSEGGATDARARRILYSASENTLTFERNAVIEQDGNRFSGDLIHYDTSNRVVTAETRAEDSDSQGRVEMVIQPRQSGSGDSGSR